MNGDHITSSPLCWPPDWIKETTYIRSRFGKWNKPVSIQSATVHILMQLRLMTPSVPEWNIIISSDLRLRLDGLPISSQRQPEEKGVAVWWRPNEESKDYRVIALNKYDRIGDNLYAIGKTLEAMRSIERWGSGEILERTFTGFTALPYLSGSWREVLDYYGGNLAEAERAYKTARSGAHPDHGGTSERFGEVNVAWGRAQVELAKG